MLNLGCTLIRFSTANDDSKAAAARDFIKTTMRQLDIRESRSRSELGTIWVYWAWSSSLFSRRPAVHKSPLSPSPPLCRNQKIQPTSGRPGTSKQQLRKLEVRPRRLVLMDGRAQLSPAVHACQESDCYRTTYDHIDQSKVLHGNGERGRPKPR